MFENILTFILLSFCLVILGSLLVVRIMERTGHRSQRTNTANDWDIDYTDGSYQQTN